MIQFWVRHCVRQFVLLEDVMESEVKVVMKKFLTPLFSQYSQVESERVSQSQSGSPTHLLLEKSGWDPVYCLVTD